MPGSGLKQACVALALVVLCLPLLWTGAPRASAEPAGGDLDGPVYFQETGFWVTAPFIDYWQANGGLMTFGYPLSRVFYQDGLHRQYFERAIFERHENLAGTPFIVQLVRLGANSTVERQRFDEAFQPVEEDAGALAHEGLYFPETGHHLNGVFLNYWLAHGGLQTFGYPLSEPFAEPGGDGVLRLTQYFERNRFEHHLNHAGTPFEVLLGHLGREALAVRDVPPLAIQPQRAMISDRDAAPLGPLPVREPGSIGCGHFFLLWGHAHDNERNAYYLDAAAASGCEWVRMQFSWEYLEPTPEANLLHRLWPLRNAVTMARERGLRVMVSVSTPPEWARPDDPAQLADPEQFGELMSALAHEFRGQVDAWQIWNEPNIIAEANGLIDPAGLFAVLQAAYPAVKAADPEALVVFPGLAPNSLMIPDYAMDSTWYLEMVLRMHNGEAAEYFDVLGVHAYGAGNDPDTYWPGNLSDRPGWVSAPEFYFRGAESSRRILVELGLADKPIWFTEMGWPAGDYNPIWGYGRWITDELQEQYILRAFEIMRTEWDWVELAFVFILNAEEFSGATVSPFAGFSLIRGDRTPRLAFTAMSTHSAEWRGLER